MTSSTSSYVCGSELEKQTQDVTDPGSPTESRKSTLNDGAETTKDGLPELSDEEFEREINATVTIPLMDYPKGYPLQAAFQSSEPSWSIYRAFGYLHSRVILDMQDELRALEDQLQDMDLIDSGDPDDNVSGRVRSRRTDRRQGINDNSEGVSIRATLISKIRAKLVNYDELLIKARDMNAFQRPSNRDYRSFRTWFFGVNPLDDDNEDKFIRRREDLISLRRSREWSSFDGCVETSIRFMHTKLKMKFLQRIFATKELRDKTIGGDGTVFYYSHSRIEKLVGVIITMIIFVLLILPVVAMYKLTSIGERNSTFDAVGVLVVFTLLFSAAMSLLTKAQRHEVFAASAAYCAVLVVFISNFQNDNAGGGRA